MAYQVVWADESKTIIRQIYTGKIVIDDYYAAIKENAEMMASVPHTVDLIMDISEGTTDLRGFLAAAKYADKLVPPNQRLVVAVGANAFIQAMGNMARRFAPKATENVHFVDTLDQAFTLIHEYRAALDTGGDQPEDHRS